MTGFRTLGEKRTQETLKAELASATSSDSHKQNAPLGVAILLDVVLALAEGVPELDRPVTRARDDLPVVSREADGEDIGGVADEAAGRVASVEIPQAERVVPGGRERELAVRGDHDVRHEVVVPVQDALRVPVRVLVARKLPDDDRLVCTSCKASTPCPSILPRLRLSRRVRGR